MLTKKLLYRALSIALICGAKIASQEQAASLAPAHPPQASSKVKLSGALAHNQVDLNNAHAVDQRVIITKPKNDPTDCTQLHGKEFMDCMACQSSENVKKNIMNCNDRMARHYFLNLSLEEYHEVLQHFSEKEWEEFYASRTEAERGNFPQTWQEQRAMLKELYLDAYYNNFEHPYNSLEYAWSSNTRATRDSLEKLINDYHQRCVDKWIYQSTINNLHHKFYVMRKKLFTKPCL